MHSVTLLALLLTVAFSLLPPSFAVRAEDPTEPANAYTERKVVFTGGEYKSREFRYRLLVPADYAPGAKGKTKKWPLILFLHGAGERGDDNKAQLKYFPGDMASPDNRKKNPVFILAPQCPNERAWSGLDLKTLDGKFQPEPADMEKAVLQMLEEVEKEFPIDPDRVYLTGLSMGGFGTWDLAVRYPKRWAAAAPICGGGDPSKASALKDLPIWAFHGAKDPVVPPAKSRDMIDAIQKAGGKPKYTEFPEAGHDSWTPGYKHPGFLEWLLEQRRKPG